MKFNLIQEITLIDETSVMLTQPDLYQISSRKLQVFQNIVCNLMDT